MNKESEQIIEEIKKLPLIEQAKIIREIEKYKKEILDELDAEPRECSPADIIKMMRELGKRTRWPEIEPPKYKKPYPTRPWWYDPGLWVTICTDSSANSELVKN